MKGFAWIDDLATLADAVLLIAVGAFALVGVAAAFGLDIVATLKGIVG
ncbi:MAG: hypothetical protein AB7G13_11665 [Lautropia sp.]